MIVFAGLNLLCPETLCLYFCTLLMKYLLSPESLDEISIKLKLWIIFTVFFFFFLTLKKMSTLCYIFATIVYFYSHSLKFIIFILAKTH